MEDNTWSIIFLSFQRIPNSLQYLRKRMEHFLEKASHRIFLGQVNLPHQKLSGHLRCVNWWNESIYLFCKRPPPPPPPRIAPLLCVTSFYFDNGNIRCPRQRAKFFEWAAKDWGRGSRKSFGWVFVTLQLLLKRRIL